MLQASSSRNVAAFFAVVFSTVLFVISASAAAREQTAYTFNRTDGDGYGAGLKVDANGNIWGISTSGGTYGYGNVFRLSRDASGHFTETVIWNFTSGNDGGFPGDDA